MPVPVTDREVRDGDPLYEGDVLTATATLYETAAPDDLDYVYTGLFRWHFAYDDGSGIEKTTDTGVYTVTETNAGTLINNYSLVLLIQ